MKLVIQRVTSANVIVDKQIINSIEKGLVILAGLMENDEKEDLEWGINKVLNLRLFNNWKDSVVTDKAEILSISQFTLGASLKKGTKPDFHRSMKTESAKAMYSEFLILMRAKYDHVYDGEFGAMMQVNIQNDGPVTIILDSKNRE